MEEAVNSLVIKLAKGDTDAFNHFYRTYYKRMFNFANSYCRNEFVAGNIVQDTFLGLWENRENLESEINLPAYLLTIVKNKALNHFHRATIKTKVKENVQNHAMRELELRCSLLTACNPEEMFHSEIVKIIEKTLETLPNQCRKVIMMSRFEGFTHKEIASKLDISLKAVEYHITKALKLLRVNLKDYLIIIAAIILSSVCFI
jgi:RNA polymerase sigma-70 factor (ECF subfamily)